MQARYFIPNPTMASLAILCLLTLTGVAKASTREYSSGEDIVFAFFKAGDITPNFDSWARKTDTYKRTAPARVGEYIQKETERLSKRWDAYRPDEELITIRTPVDITLSVEEKQDGTRAYWMQINFADNNPAFYFSAQYQDYIIALIPQKMEQLMMQPLRAEEFTALSEKYNGLFEGKADFFVEMKPVRAYTSQPYNFEGVEQWVLLTDVVGLSLNLPKTDTSIWNYGANWYVSPKTEELQGLFKAGAH